MKAKLILIGIFFLKNPITKNKKMSFSSSANSQYFGVIFSLRNAVVRCTSMQYEKNGWGSSLQLEDSKRRQLKTLEIVRQHSMLLLLPNKIFKQNSYFKTISNSHQISFYFFPCPQKECFYSEVPNKSVSFFILFWIFPTYLAFLGTTHLFIFGKIFHLYCILCNKYRKIPTYTPLLRPTHLLISEKTSHLHGYQGSTLIGNSRVISMYIPDQQ